MSENRVPTLHRHATGQAFVRVREHGRARDIYLGRYDTAEARKAYGAFLAAHVAGEPYLPSKRRRQRDATADESNAASTTGTTVNELLLTYWHEETGRRSENVQLKVRLSMVPLRKLYGDTAAGAFRPRALASVRDAMMRTGRLSRGEINERVSNVRKFFRWCVSRELIGPSVAHALDALPNLRAGEVTGLREPKVIGAARWVDVDATLPHLSSPLRGAVLTMWWSGMRACEALQMRPRDIDRAVSPWRYLPATHKTQRFGRARTIFLGPPAQAALAPLLGAQRVRVQSARRRRGTATGEACGAALADDSLAASARGGARSPTVRARRRPLLHDCVQSCRDCVARPRYFGQREQAGAQQPVVLAIQHCTGNRHGPEFHVDAVGRRQQPPLHTSSCPRCYAGRIVDRHREPVKASLFNLLSPVRP